MALAVSKPLAVFTDNVNRNSYSASSYTPTANSVQLIIATMTGFTGTPTISGGSGWSTSPALISGGSATFNSGASTIAAFYGVAGASPGSFTCTIGCTGATGCMMSFFEITGASTSSPIVQTKIKNSTTAANPTLTFDANLNTNNCYFMGIANTANPAAVTPPTSWTEGASGGDDTGHSSPTTGLETSYRINGESGATITATRTSINHGIVAVEIAVASGANTTVVPNVGSYSVSGTSLTGLKIGRKVIPTVGSYSVTGTNLTALRKNTPIVPATGSYSRTGTDLTALKIGRNIVSTPGSYAVSGSSVNLSIGRKVICDSGSYSATGTDLNALKTGRNIALDPGAYEITGNDVELIKTGQNNYAVMVTPGEYALTGNEVILTVTSTTPTTPDNTADVGPGDYSPIYKEFKLKGEKRTRLKKSVVKKIKEVVREQPTEQALTRLTREVLPFLSDSAPVVSEIQTKMDGAIADLLSGIEKAQTLAALEEQQRQEMERVIIAVLATHLRQQEEDEILLAYLL